MRGFFICFAVFSLVAFPEAALSVGATTGVATGVAKEVTTVVAKQSATSCQADTDCMLVKADCCGCNANGNSTAVHTSQQAAHNSALNQYCSSQQTMCSMMTVCHLVQAKCENSQCVATGPKTVPVKDFLVLTSSAVTPSPDFPSMIENNAVSSDSKCPCCPSGSSSSECQDTQWSHRCQCMIPSSQYSGEHVMTEAQEVSLQAAKKQNESALKKTKKQRRNLLLAAIVNGGAGAYLLKCQCNPSEIPRPCGKTEADPLAPIDTPAEAAGAETGLLASIKNLVTGGPPETYVGCVLGPLAIAQALMHLKRRNELGKTEKQLAGGGTDTNDDFTIPDVDVPCPEDPTKTCRIVKWGTAITTADGGVRDIKEVVDALPPEHQKERERLMAQAMEAQPSVEELKALQSEDAELQTENVKIAGSPVNKQTSGTGFPPVSAENSANFVVPVASYGNPSGQLPQPLTSTNWQKATCEVPDSVVSVSDEGGGMADVLCNSAGENVFVRGTSNPPLLSCPGSTSPAVAIRNAVGPWHTVSCGSPHVSLRDTNSGLWADVTCPTPTAKQVVAVRIGDTGRWVETECPQAGRLITMRASQPAEQGALYAQFVGNVGSSETVKSLPFGNDRIAPVDSNLFNLTNNQYEDLRDRGEFIEGDNTPPYEMPHTPSGSSGTQ